MVGNSAEISIRSVSSRTDHQTFIKLPNRLYGNNPCYVPPLYKAEEAQWDEAINPALQHHHVQRYLAWKDGKAIGRIAVFMEKMADSQCRFGWFDIEEDQEAAHALLAQAEATATSWHANELEGPLGFTNLDKAGMLTYGFDRPATIIGLYNAPYYPRFLEQAGYSPKKEWVEYEITFPEILPDKVIRINKIIREKYHLKPVVFKSKQDILSYVPQMFELLDATYRHLSTYTPLSDAERKVYQDEYFKFIDKDFVVAIEDAQHRLIAFAITMPSYTEALQKANGRLFPFGWYYLLRAKHLTQTANFYLIGVHPEYQKKGITAMIFEQLHHAFRANGIKVLETNPELVENKDIQLLWQDYEAKNHKRRATFSKELT